MSCNPAIGGLAKGHLVKEIDALGGEMAKNIDKTGIQFRRLNTKKGPAVRSSRAQADKKAYQDEMKRVLEAQERLDIKQVLVEELLVENGSVHRNPEPDKDRLFRGDCDSDDWHFPERHNPYWRCIV